MRNIQETHDFNCAFRGLAREIVEHLEVVRARYELQFIEAGDVLRRLGPQTSDSPLQTFCDAHARLYSAAVEMVVTVYELVAREYLSIFTGSQYRRRLASVEGELCLYAEIRTYELLPTLPNCSDADEMQQLKLTEPWPLYDKLQSRLLPITTEMERDMWNRVASKKIDGTAGDSNVPAARISNETADGPESRAMREPDDHVLDGPADRTGHAVHRRAEVDKLIAAVHEQMQLKVTRKMIWGAVGHGSSQQFLRWQRGDEAKTTRQDRINFARIVKMDPAEFVSLLEKRHLLPAKFIAR